MWAPWIVVGLLFGLLAAGRRKYPAVVAIPLGGLLGPASILLLFFNSRKMIGMLKWPWRYLVRAIKKKRCKYPHFPQHEEVFTRQDFDELRVMLQKTAYSMVRKDVPEEVKREFNALMTDFAAADPFTREALASLMPIIASRPGIRQAQIYTFLPHYSTEAQRYVLYFAEEMNVIVRIKKGNSYQLYLPEQIEEIPANPG
jgi:hypothetical protein